MIPLEPLGHVARHLGIETARGDEDFAVLDQLNISTSADPFVIAELALEYALAVAESPLLEAGVGCRGGSGWRSGA